MRTELPRPPVPPLPGASEPGRRLLQGLWRIAAVTLLGLCAGSTAMAMLCVNIAGRMVAAIEQLDGVAVAMNTAHAAAPPPVCDRSPSPPPPAPPAAPRWPVGLGIIRLGPTHFLVDRRLLDVVVHEQAVILRQPRVVPDIEPGKIVGLTLFGVRPDSLLGVAERLGGIRDRPMVARAVRHQSHQ